MAAHLVARLKDKGFAYPLENIVYPGVDHYVFVADTDALKRSIEFFTSALVRRAAP